MAEKLMDTEIAREKGWMYYLKGNNPMEIWRTKMGRKKEEKVAAESAESSPPVEAPAFSTD